MNFEFVTSILRLDRLLRANDIGIEYSFMANESLIPRARNYLCQQFIDSESHTHLLFIDADIQFDAEDILRMIRADVQLIGGVYPKKKLNWEFMELGKRTTPMLEYVVVPLDTTTPITCVYDPQPVKYIGTGMMLIKREVLEIMQKKNPDDWFYADGKRYHKFFDCVLMDKVYLSEDYYFCQRWHDVGGTVYAAYWTHCTHWGMIGYEGHNFCM